MGVMARVGTCMDCGGETVGGLRGAVPKRCSPCNIKRKVDYNRERYQNFPEKRYQQPRASTTPRFRSIICSECSQPFEVQVRPGGLPKACDSCKHDRRLRVAREIVRPDEVRLAQRLRRYGLTVKQFEDMLQDQNGCCALCGRPPAGLEGRAALLEVDHCHESGNVRALLFQTCNTALGKFQDSPELLRKAADYVELHRMLGGQ